MNTATHYDFTKQRLYLELDLQQGIICPCTPSQTNYLVKVLRLKADDEIYVFNGRQGEWRAVVENIKKNSCELRIIDLLREQVQGPDIEYLFAPLKRARMDYIVQKATELGVSKLRPVITRRTIVDRVKLDRMQANIIEAAEQCGILHIPEVLPLEKMEFVLDNWQQNRSLIYCDERAAITNPISALYELKKGPIAVLIGPEGGFDTYEQEKLKSLPYVKAISLGPRIMRADTAAIAALSLVNSVLGDWGEFAK